MLTSLLLLPTLAAQPAPAATKPMVSFQIQDETDAAEISEDTVIFIDGKLVAHFVLDQQHTDKTEMVTLQAAAHYDYALCGRITILRPDGGQEQRVVDGGASLTNVDGRVFRALAAHDFTIFYLAEASIDVPNVPLDAHHTNACSLPVS